MSNSVDRERPNRLAHDTGTPGKRVRAPLPFRSPEPLLRKAGRGWKRKETFCSDRLLGARSQVFGGLEHDR